MNYIWIHIADCTTSRKATCWTPTPKIFTNNVKAIENNGSEIGNNPTLLKLEEEWEDIDINWQVATKNYARTVDTIA